MKNRQSAQRSNDPNFSIQSSTFGVLRSLVTAPPTPNSSLLTPPFEERKGARAFTLFELLAVLTVIGIGLMILVGSYGSWGTAHALTGATRIVEAGLQQARTLAITQRAYVAFSYGSTNPPNATLTVTTGFQPFCCTNKDDTVVSEADLRNLVETMTKSALTFLPPDGTKFPSLLVIEPAAPFQRLPGHVRLSRRQTSNPDPAYTTSIVIFRPDGSIMTDDGITLPTDPHHTITIETVEAFSIPEGTGTAPLLRFFRVDPATGFVTVIGGTP